MEQINRKVRQILSEISPMTTELNWVYRRGVHIYYHLGKLAGLLIIRAHLHGN